MTSPALISGARNSFHATLLDSVLRIDAQGIPSNADRHNKTSVSIAKEILALLGTSAVGTRLAGQQSGSKFEEICKEFIELTFRKLHHLRPGNWEVRKEVGRRSSIANYDQYEHLAALDEACKEHPELAAALGSDYLIKPDIVVIRAPEEDKAINMRTLLVDEHQARFTPLRRLNSSRPILHASVSCKWTLRSDRAQNSRSEAMNLVTNRKGRLPHVVVVTGEPTPSRIASIALGTGQIDCVYHFALPELRQAVEHLQLDDAKQLLDIMTEGKRLRDIADLPFDLVI